MGSNFDSCANNFAGCLFVFNWLSLFSNVGYSSIRNAFCAFTNLLKAFFQLSDFDLFAHIKHKYEWHSFAAKCGSTGCSQSDSNAYQFEHSN